jgi:hypothetical protein
LAGASEGFGVLEQAASAAHRSRGLITAEPPATASLIRVEDQRTRLVATARSPRHIAGAELDLVTNVHGSWLPDKRRDPRLTFSLIEAIH